MPNAMTRKRQVLPWAVCIAAGVLGIATGPFLEERARNLSPGVHVGVSRVRVTENLVPPCGKATSRTRDLIVVSGHMKRDVARGVASVDVSSGGRSWKVRRSGNLCTVEGDEARRDEPCLVESCNDDICALRFPLDAGRLAEGPVTARYADAAGAVVGEGRSIPGPIPSGTPPALDVTRSGDALGISAPDAAEGSGRVTILRQGRAVADAPLRFERPGYAQLSVPEGIDSVVVAISAGGPGGVLQSNAHLDGPFDGTCGGP